MSLRFLNGQVFDSQLVQPCSSPIWSSMSLITFLSLDKAKAQSYLYKCPTLPQKCIFTALAVF